MCPHRSLCALRDQGPRSLSVFGCRMRLTVTTASQNTLTGGTRMDWRSVRSTFSGPGPNCPMCSSRLIRHNRAMRQKLVFPHVSAVAQRQKVIAHGHAAGEWSGWGQWNRGRESPHLALMSSNATLWGFYGLDPHREQA